MIDGGELDAMLDDIVRAASGSAVVLLKREKLDTMRAIIRDLYERGYATGYKAGYDLGLSISHIREDGADSA